MSAVSTSSKKYKHDGKTTYCYFSTIKYSDELKADPYSSAVGADCPVQLTVGVPLPVKLGAVVPIKYTATRKTVPLPADFEFPATADAVISRAPVPKNLLSESNTNATVLGVSGSGSGSAADAALADALEAKSFDVPVANVVICEYGKCDVFSSESGTYYKSGNDPDDFVNGELISGSSGLRPSSRGKYTGFAHLVINVGDNSRADFVTYFPVQVGDVVGTEPLGGIAADSKTTYCWTARDYSPFDDRVDSSITVRTDASCPATMTAKVSKKNVFIDEEFKIEWSLQHESAREANSVIAEVSEKDAIKDPATGIYSVVPVSVLSACQQSVADAKCSSYAGNDSTTKDIVKFANSNFTDGTVSYSTSHKFAEPGQYLLISRVAMQTTDGERIDFAVYSSVDVAIPESKSGMMFLYIGLAIGALILFFGFMYCYLRKRRVRRAMKQIPFRAPMPPQSAVDRASQYTATSSNFITHRSPQMHQHQYNMAYADNDTGSFYPANGGADGGMGGMGGGDPRQHKDSFSLDPYSRNSFNEIGEDESIDMTIRPSDASKFSFQTGYDDDSEWEYDTRSLRSDSDFSDAPGRGTFHLQSGKIGSLPIMEEEERGIGAIGGRRM